jgi:hypothetical protein
MPSQAVSTVQFKDIDLAPAAVDVDPPMPGSTDSWGTAAATTAWVTHGRNRHGLPLPGSAKNNGTFVHWGDSGADTSVRNAFPAEEK